MRRWVVTVLLMLVTPGVTGPDAGASPRPWTEPATREPAANGEPGVSLHGRIVRVGLPNPRRVRGMLHGSIADPQGFLKEVAREALSGSGAQIVFVPFESERTADGTAALRNGQIDVLTGLMVTEPRLAEFSFTAPVMISSGVAVTRQADGRAPSSLDDLRRLRVVVPNGGAGQQHAAEQALPVRVLPTFIDCLIAVQSGQADACLTLSAAAVWEIEASRLSGLRVSPVTKGGFWRAHAMALRKDETALLAALDSGLSVMRDSGRFDDLYKQEVARYQPLPKPSTVEVQTVLHWAAAGALALAAMIVLWQWRQRSRLQSLTNSLADGERRYRGIFDHSQDAIFTVDPVTACVIEANASFSRMYGYTSQEATGLPLSTFTVDHSIIRPRIERVLDEGAISKARSLHRHKNGSLLHVEISASTAEIAGRRVIVSINRDVTAAASAEELIRAVISASPHVAIQGFDRTGRVKFWNAASYKLYGWTEAEAVGRNMGELLGDSVTPGALVELLSTIERDKRPSGVMEFKVITRSGEEKWVLSEITFAPGSEGSPVFVCVDVDITPIRTAKQQLQDAQARLASALRAAGMGTWSIDVRSMMIAPDPSILRLFELDPADTTPQPLAQFASRIHPDDAPRVQEAIAKAIRGDDNYRAEYRLVLPHGRTRWLSSRGMPIRDADGRVVAVSGACTDVTESKRAAEEAERLRDQLERARRLEGIGLLAGGVAHDFNNLLVGIRGNAELALGLMPADHPARPQIQAVLNAAERSAELTAQLLTSAGRSRLALEPVDLNALVGETVALLGQRMGGSSRITLELDGSLPPTSADAAQVRQVIANLVVNAADAAPAFAAGGRITLRTGLTTLVDGACPTNPDGSVPSAGQYLVLDVHDNGAGIPPQCKGRLFEPFFTTKAEGRGLGLSTVLMSVRRHGGAVIVESDPGRGTTFRVLLPVVSQSPGPVAGSPQTKHVEAGAPGIALVVDDDPMVCSVISAMLSEQGWQVSVAGSGDEAISACTHQSFDVVFLDLTMPGLSGTQTAARLRTIKPGVPIVFVSGYSREMAESSGALTGEHFVQKPFSSATLAQAASRAREQSQRGRGLAGAGAS